MIFVKLFVSIISVIIIGCFLVGKPKYDKGFIPERVTNFQSINTEYDDMNLAFSPPPAAEESFMLFMSSNRTSQGDYFDIHEFSCHINFTYHGGDFTLTSNHRNFTQTNINSSFNEIGPYLYVNYLDTSINDFLFLFSSSRNNSNQNIYAAKNLKTLSFTTGRKDIETVELTNLNSEFDDSYPIIAPDGNIYFCSNRSGSYNIYSYPLLSSLPLTNDNIIAILTDSLSESTASLVENINSDGDEMCPFIVDDKMYFVSNRDGGFGGFDIYVSHFSNNSWQEPVNLGRDFNTEHDEFRPIFIKLNEEKFNNDLFLFSSNRPGGKGGYDIYFKGYRSSK